LDFPTSLKKSHLQFQPFTGLPLLLTERHLQQAITISAAIVRKASQGDDTARAALYHQYSQKMFSICVRMTGSRRDAEDILQDAFLLAFKSLQQLKDHRLFEPWLRKIVVNECIRFTKRAFQFTAFHEQTFEQAAEEETGWWQQIGFDQIHNEIKNLPHGCREIFNLYVVEDYSHQQIAEALNISVSTSKSQYSRARLLLKERLLKQMERYGSI
jgi:RNA polymerase sigma factor (sigma-70 family)